MKLFVKYVEITIYTTYLSLVETCPFSINYTTFIYKYVLLINRLATRDLFSNLFAIQGR